MSDAKANGAQAAHPISPQVEIDVTGGSWGSLGLTKRELFAAMAMQGLASNPGGPWQANSLNGWALANCKLEDIAEVCTQAADALLAELAKVAS